MTAALHLLVDLDNIMFLRGEARVDILKLRLKTIVSEHERALADATAEAVLPGANGRVLTKVKANVKAKNKKYLQDDLSCATIHWFCNVDTDAALKKARIVLRGEQHVYASETDCADHALVQHLAKMGSVVTIVTNDVSLMRLAMYTTQRSAADAGTAAATAGAKRSISKRLRIQFLSFGEGVTLKPVAPQLLVFDSTHDLRKFVTTVILYDSRYPLILNASRARVTPTATASRSLRSLTSSHTL